MPTHGPASGPTEGSAPAAGLATAAATLGRSQVTAGHPLDRRRRRRPRLHDRGDDEAHEREADHQHGDGREREVTWGAPPGRLLDGMEACREADAGDEEHAADVAAAAAAQRA